MSESQGTNATTGTVELTDDQLRAMDTALVEFLATSDQTVEGLVTQGIALVDGCLDCNVYKVARDADGNPFADGPSYVLARIAAAPNFGKAIAYPIAQRLLLLTDEKDKRVFSVREVESATGVSRGVLNGMNQDAKQGGRKPRPNADTAERTAAKNAVKRLENTAQAVMDALQHMTSEERETVLTKLAEVVSVVTKYHALPTANVDQSGNDQSDDAADTNAADEAAKSASKPAPKPRRKAA